MNRIKLQLRELELVTMIVYSGIIDHNINFEDYPELNDELKKIQGELYPKEEDK